MKNESDILDRICSLLKENGKSQKELCDYLQINNRVFTEWKAGRNKSYTKYIYQIASYLDVSVDYLLGRSDTPKEPTESGERNVVRIAGRDGSYFEKRLTDEQIKALKAMIEQLPEVPDDL